MPAPGLDQLRDIHPPPGMAFWQLLGDNWPLIGLALAGLGWWMLRRNSVRSSVAGRRQALTQLREAQQRYARDGDAVHFARALEAVLRKEAIRRYPDRKVQRLTGDDWLAFLDDTGRMDAFCRGPGRCLASLPYQRSGQIESADVVKLVARWLAH